MSGSEPIEIDVPDVEECDRRTKQFAEITGTDEACGHFYLQDHDWNVENAVGRYFNEQGDTTSASALEKVPEDEEDIVFVEEVKGQQNTNPKEQQNSVEMVDDSRGPLPDFIHGFKLMSWNIDGLDTKNLNTRIRAVCTVIIKEKPTVVFLQEVIDIAFSLIDSMLWQEYELISGINGIAQSDGYYTATLINRLKCRINSNKIVKYPTSVMERNMLIIKADIGTNSVTLINTHLESTKDHSQERIKQLKLLFQTAVDEPENSCIILGGDLNIRDSEIDSVGGLPNRLQDLWQKTGSKKSIEYTWDMLKNDNLHFEGKFKPRCRFDRLYMSSDCKDQMQCTDFMLVGNQRIKTIQCFPSDHFALLTNFKFVTK